MWQKVKDRPMAWEIQNQHDLKSYKFRNLPYYSYFSFLPQTVQCWTAYIIKINHLVKWLIFNTVKGTEIPVVTILLRFQGKANFTHGVQFGCFRLCIRFSVILRYSIKWLELRFYEMSKNSCLDTNYITRVRHRMSGFFFLADFYIG